MREKKKCSRFVTRFCSAAASVVFRRGVVRYTAFVLFFLVALLSSARASIGGVGLLSQTGTPNIVFILLDDLGFADLGAYGNQFILTPNIDALAGEGVRFTQFYSNGPVCSPGRVGLLSGKYPQRFGVRGNFSGSRRGIPDDTLADVLRDEGYVTGHIGKWMVGRSSPYRPMDKGFDTTIIFKFGSANPSRYFDPIITIDETETVEHEGHLTEILTDYAIDFIDDQASDTFFLNLWYSAPHHPLEPPGYWATQYPDTDEGKFAALVSNVDEQIGRILSRLDSLGIAEDTVVIVASDNGGVAEVHSSDPLTGPSNLYSGAKGMVAEGGMRVPLIVRWRGVFAELTDDESVLMGHDLLPTIAEAVGADVSSLELDGESFLSVLLGAGPRPRSDAVYWEDHFHQGQREVDQSEDSWDQGAVRDGNWKLVLINGTTRLFDIVADPMETTDLAGTDPVRVSDLLAQHREWRLATGLIDHEVKKTYGNVSVNNDEWDFTAGAVELETNPLFDVDEMDFTFAANLTPYSIGAPQVIASFGSWTLELNEAGKVVLTLESPDAPNGIVTLVSGTPLQANHEHHVAFTLYSWSISSFTTVRLNVDGVLEAEDGSLQSLSPATRPLIGAQPGDHKFLSGIVKGLEIYSMALTQNEITEISE